MVDFISQDAWWRQLGPEADLMIDHSTQSRERGRQGRATPNGPAVLPFLVCVDFNLPLSFTRPLLSPLLISALSSPCHPFLLVHSYSTYIKVTSSSSVSTWLSASHRRPPAPSITQARAFVPAVPPSSRPLHSLFSSSFFTLPLLLFSTLR